MRINRYLDGVSAAALLSVMLSGPVFAQAVAEPQASEEADGKAIVVTGSRLPSGFSAPTPVTAISADQLETRASSSVSEALTEVPSFRNGIGVSQGTGGTFFVGQGLLDLRGLGTTRTLVLVDGRRHVPNNANGTWDTNVLPTALIKQIDVVTGGASAAYGSDAVAGVVNLILDDRLEGVKGSVQAGISQYGDAAQYQLNLAAGTSFADGRGHIVIGLDYNKGEPSGNMYSRDWGRREPGLVSLGARAAGTPALLVTEQARIAFSPAGTILSCNTAAGPLAPCPIGGLTFDANGQPVPFVFGSVRGGAQMVGGGNEGYSQFRNTLMRIGNERITGLARASFDFSDNVTGWAEFSAGRFKVQTNTSDMIGIGGNGLTIQRDNPFIPAALAAQMDASGITRFSMARLNYAGQMPGIRTANENSFWEAAAGLKGEFGGGWKWNAHFSKGESRFTYRLKGMTVLPNYFAASYVVRDASGNPACGPIATNPMFNALSPLQRSAFAAIVSPGCVPLNPFGPASVSAAALAYVAPEDTEQLTVFDEESAAVNIAGSPFDGWAGPVTIALGAEWRRDKSVTTLSAVNTARSLVNAFWAANPQPGQGEQSVKEAYAEIGLPLLKDAPIARNFDLNAAIRATDYSVAGGVTTWKVGATWDIIDDIRIRATRSRDIRAPGLTELFYRGNDGFITNLPNPVTGLVNPINNAALNNPNLKPEKADTWTIGAVLQPTFLSGFKASIDYYDINIKGVIGTIPAAIIVRDYFNNSHPEYGQFITFDVGQPSGFRRVDTPQLNLNRQKARGLDINLMYRVPFGESQSISLSSNASRLFQLESFDPSGGSLGDLSNAIPKWRISTNLTYDSDRFSTTLTARYNSSMHYNITLVGPDSPNYNPAAANSISKNLFPSAVYFSWQAEAKVFDQADKKLSLFVVVDNLFNKEPPLGAFPLWNGVGANASSAFSPYDSIGRYFKAGARFQF